MGKLPRCLFGDDYSRDRLVVPGIEEEEWLIDRREIPIRLCGGDEMSRQCSVAELPINHADERQCIASTQLAAHLQQTDNTSAFPKTLYGKTSALGQ